MDAVKEVKTPEDQKALIEALTALIGDKQGIDESLAKQLRKSADGMAIAGVEAELDTQLSETVDSLLTTLREKTHKQVKRREQDFEEVLEMLDQADKSLKDNELKAAEESVHKLLSILGSIPGLSDQRRKKIDKRLNRIQPQMRKLKSWRHWGTSQAREDLIAKVKLLVGSRLHPKELSKTIDEARDQWRDWDKDGDHTKRQLWLEFDNACKEAFKPCKVYFGDRKKARKQAFNKRSEIIEKIKQRFIATDWKKPEYKEIDKWLRTKRSDFFKTENVEYKQRKKIFQALDDALAEFEPYLGRERTRCYKTRLKLIEGVQALDEIEDSKAAMDQLETLKKQWVVTVIEKRGLEDKLWKQYQAACDVIYNKRKCARREQDVQFEQNHKDKNVLIEELSQIAALEPLALLEQRPKFLQLLEQFKEIGYVPRKHEKSVQNRLNQVRKQFKKNLTDGEKALKSTSLNQHFELSVLCGEIEKAIINNGSKKPLIKKWATQTQAVTPNQSLQKRYDDAIDVSNNGGFSDEDLVNNLQAKQALCLKLEVIYDLDSPSEFQKQRMAYQIERLSAAMKKDSAAQDQPDQLIDTLLSLGAVPADEIDNIASRTLTCFNRHIQ